MDILTQTNENETVNTESFVWVIIDVDVMFNYNIT